MFKSPEFNQEQISKVANLLRSLPEQGNGLNFYELNIGGKMVPQDHLYPSINHPYVVDFFFFVCLHDFGFWYGDDRGYIKPLYGVVDGTRRKGSDLLWAVCIKKLKEGFSFSPGVLLDVHPERLAKIFSDDDGPIPFPDFEKRLSITRSYSKWFVESFNFSVAMFEESNEENAVLDSFLRKISHIPGYNEDYLQKRNLLLAMVLANRPEKFLKVNDPQNWRPIVDYHLMRLALRIGLVDLAKEDIENNEKRFWVSEEKEKEIRLATYWAIKKLIDESGKLMFFIDEKLWMGRKYCPEMSEPECGRCIFSSVCKKRTNLFQPIFRTTAY